MPLINLYVKIDRHRQSALDGLDDTNVDYTSNVRVQVQHTA